MKIKGLGLVLLINIIITVGTVMLLVPKIITNTTGDSERLSDSKGEFSSTLGVVDLVSEVNPAVLSIIVSQDVPVYENYLERFGPFGFSIPSRREVGTEERQVGSGSGFVVSSDGLVVTNRHVVNIMDAEYVGIDSEGQQYELELVARYDLLDIAILQMQSLPEEVVYLEFGDSDQLQLGQTVVAIGNALGEFSNSVSVGVVSGLSRSIMASSSGMLRGEAEVLDNLIQTDAAINPGNSGGPLLDLSGKVIGVNVAVARGSENIGFTIPANAVAGIVKSVVEQGKIVRPYLGVRHLMLNEQIATELGLEENQGALIYSSPPGLAVDPDSPAAQAGLREGDVIVSIDNQEVKTGTTLVTILRGYQVGSTIDVVVNRGKERITYSVTLAELKDQ